MSLVRAFNLFTFKGIIDMCVLIAVLLIVLDFLVRLYSSPPLLLFSLVIWLVSLMLFWIHSFFFFVCISTVDFWLVVTVGFWCSSLYVYKIALRSWSLNFKCVSKILHVYFHDCWVWCHTCMWVCSMFTFTCEHSHSSFSCFHLCPFLFHLENFL